MKRLNQKGWGLSAFLSFIVIFFIAIILISIGAQKVGIADGDHRSKEENPPSQESNVYTTAEIEKAKGYKTLVHDASSRYFADKHKDRKERLVLSASELVNAGYLESLSVAGNFCSGYSIIDIKDGVPQIQSFVQCGNVYMTEGYDFSLES